MKGLLLKDFYMIARYCRFYPVIVVIFLLASIFNDSLFFSVYPCLLASLIPNTLLSYDERSKWETLASTMPVTKNQMVSSKYLIGLICQVITYILSVITLIIKMNRFNTGMTVFIANAIMMFMMSLMTTAIAMPFMFKFGVEKGRIYYYVVFILFGGSLVGGAAFLTPRLAESSVAIPPVLLPAMILVTIGLYALSWFLSARFYSKRDF